MSDLSTITTFLGWCTIVNLGILPYSSLMTTVFNSTAKRLHTKIFPISPKKLDEAYFNFLGNYKLAIFIFNFAPYCALKIMA